MHLLQTFIIITYKDMRLNSYFTIIKTLLFGFDYFMRNIFRGEKQVVKLISLFIFFVISLVNISVIVSILLYKEV
jgi:hypothetical protein